MKKSATAPIITSDHPFHNKYARPEYCFLFFTNCFADSNIHVTLGIKHTMDNNVHASHPSRDDFS